MELNQIIIDIIDATDTPYKTVEGANIARQEIINKGKVAFKQWAEARVPEEKEHTERCKYHRRHHSHDCDCGADDVKEVV
ncbi:MAG: hypothetical protein HQ579_02925 [Candidatus Omnitrophica bacterium]|nr:hypothetical protein [Candidatus Omnitrophota bacterium]